MNFELKKSFTKKNFCMFFKKSNNLQILNFIRSYAEPQKLFVLFVSFE